MPLEVRELVIKAQVGKANNANQSSTMSNPMGSGSINQKELVQLCLEQVLEILKEKTER